MFQHNNFVLETVLMKPTLKQYLSVCKAERSIKESLNMTQDHYEPVKVRVLMKNVKEINDQLTKSVKDDNYSTFFDKSFQKLQNTLKSYDQEKKRAKDHKTEIYESLFEMKEANKVRTQAEKQILQSLQTLKGIKSKPRQTDKNSLASAQKKKNSNNSTAETVKKQSPGPSTEKKTNKPQSLLKDRKKHVPHVGINGYEKFQNERDSQFFGKFYALKGTIGL